MPDRILCLWQCRISLRACETSGSAVRRVPCVCEYYLCASDCCVCRCEVVCARLCAVCASVKVTRLVGPDDSQSASSAHTHGGRHQVSNTGVVGTTRGPGPTPWKRRQSSCACSRECAVCLHSLCVPLCASTLCLPLYISHSMPPTLRLPRDAPHGPLLDSALHPKLAPTHTMRVRSCS